MKKHISNIREKAGRHKTLIQNFSYLSALQVFNMILPLITYPYLIRILGKETYGLVVFAQAIIGYLVILVSFGFNISATKDVSVHRADKNKLNEIVSSVLIIKGGLFLIALGLLSTLIFFIPQVHKYKALFFLTMWICLYDVIFPSWYFQGIERMKYITYITLISRFTFLGLIFAFVHSHTDYLYIPIINGIGALLAGTTSLYIIFRKHDVRFGIQSLSTLKSYFKDSAPIFISNVSIQLYISTNKVIVGALLGMAEVAYYDLGEKLLNILKIPVTILSQTIFPQMSKQYNKARVIKLTQIVFYFALILILFLQIFTNQIITIIAGNDMLPAANVVRLLTLSILPLIWSNLIGVQTLLTQGYKKEFTKVVVYSFFVYALLVVSLLLFKNLNIYSLSAIQFFVELYMLIHFYLIGKNNYLI